MTTNEYIKAVRRESFEPFPGRLWQRNYYERVIRTDSDLDNVRKYIQGNPAKWEEDEDNPRNHTSNARRPTPPTRK